MKKDSILLWDIETSLMGVTTFQLKTDYIHHQNIIKDWHLISASWKWLGGKKVYHAINKKGDNDKDLIVRLSKLLASADVIVHHNGDKFDIKKFNTRMAYHGITPTYKKLRTVDMLKEARKHFAFSSNTLSYIARYLKVVEKKKGNHDLWLKEFMGDKSFARDMLEYNDGDVEALEAIYLQLRPYIDHPNMQNGDKYKCINCGSEHTQKRGSARTRAGMLKQRNQCIDCGRWFETKIE